MGYEVILTLGAENDLEEIVSYIARDKPDIAAKVGADIIRHFRVLQNFPQLGRVVPEFGEDCLREIIHAPYRLIYEINERAQRIEVIRIWHGARGTSELRKG